MVVENPGDVRVNLSITMTVNQWTLVVDALNVNLKANWNGSVAALKDAIGDATEKIRESVTSDPIKIVNE